MRTAQDIRDHIAAASKAIERHEQRGAELRRQLGRLLIEARDHPELTLEEGRQVPTPTIPRATANRLVRAANYDRSKVDPYDQAHGL